MTSHAGPLVFVHFYLDCLSHASYLVGDRSTGRAVVVDPRRDVNAYLATAERHGLTIERVIETHIHASVLRARGFQAVDLRGGFSSWRGTVDRPTEPAPDGIRA